MSVLMIDGGFGAFFVEFMTEKQFFCDKWGFFYNLLLGHWRSSLLTLIWRVPIFVRVFVYDYLWLCLPVVLSLYIS